MDCRVAQKKSIMKLERDTGPIDRMIDRFFTLHYTRGGFLLSMEENRQIKSKSKANTMTGGRGQTGVESGDTACCSPPMPLQGGMHRRVPTEKTYKKQLPAVLCRELPEEIIFRNGGHQEIRSRSSSLERLVSEVPLPLRMESARSCLVFWSSTIFSSMVPWTIIL